MAIQIAPFVDDNNTADYATTAGSANTANTAGYATRAGSADTATSANYASSVGSVAWSNITSRPDLRPESLLAVKSFTFSISASSWQGDGTYSSISYSGFTPIAIVGFYLDNTLWAINSIRLIYENYSYAVKYGYVYIPDAAAIRSSGTHTANCTVDILYYKNVSTGAGGYSPT